MDAFERVAVERGAGGQHVFGLTVPEAFGGLGLALGGLFIASLVIEKQFFMVFMADIVIRLLSYRFELFKKCSRWRFQG